MNESFSIISHWFCKSRSVKIRKHGLTGLMPHIESLKFVPSYCTDSNRKWSKFPYMSRTQSCTWLLLLLSFNSFGNTKTCHLSDCNLLALQSCLAMHEVNLDIVTFFQLPFFYNYFLKFPTFDQQREANFE